MTRTSARSYTAKRKYRRLMARRHSHHLADRIILQITTQFLRISVFCLRLYRYHQNRALSNSVPTSTIFIQHTTQTCIPRYRLSSRASYPYSNTPSPTCIETILSHKESLDHASTPSGTNQNRQNILMTKKGGRLTSARCGSGRLTDRFSCQTCHLQGTVEAWRLDATRLAYAAEKLK